MICKNQKATKIKAFIEWLGDLAEDHPFEIGLSIALILFGARSLFTGLDAVPGSVNILPVALAILYCSLSAFGGFSVIFGLMCKIRFGWAYGAERLGLFISASAWASYIVGIALGPTNKRSTLVMLALAALSVGCLLRARAIGRREKATLFALRYFKLDQEDRDG